MTSQRLTASQYATYRGVSCQAVLYAIRQKRIETDADGKIDPVTADASWAANTRGKVDANPKGQNAASTYQKARTQRERYEAKLSKLDYEERSEKLIDGSKVQMAWFEVTRMIRDGVLTIPDRLASLLAAETDPHKIHMILEEELRKSLGEIATQIESDQAMPLPSGEGFETGSSAQSI